MDKGRWDDSTVNDLMQIWRNHPAGQTVVPGPISAKRAETVLQIYAEPDAFGEKYVNSLHAYYEVFFSEEERRIASKMEQALNKAKAQVEKVGTNAYLASLTEKMVGKILSAEEVILAPSYWCSPGFLYNSLDEDRMLLLFGARPKEESLVPGEIVPEDLLLRLKAMTDPTRMRILRYLLQEQLTPAELARRLRLRAPTVTHHLHTLKSAGMVHFVRKGKNEHLYYAKMESVKELYVMLKDFLEQDVNLVEGFDLFNNELF
jgi:DNA-binding transcriptional ArsR family regulator